MSDSVIIKSFPHGISIRILDDAPMDVLLNEIGNKFSQGRSFFKNATMALSVEGRKLTDAEELAILNTIRKNSDLNIVCLVGKDESTERHYVRALKSIEMKLSRADEGQFYKGTLKNNETLETENSIVIMGDVYPGSAIISTKNIIVLGGLYGEAYAGASGNENSFVVALEMEPEKLKIGDFNYKSTKASKWSIRPKVQPKIAYVKNEKIVMENLTKEILGSF